MDARQKAKDLLRLALHEGTEQEEREAATTQLLRLIDKYDLLSAGGKQVNVAASILEKIANPDFMGDVADRVEKFASGFDRATTAFKRVAGVREQPRRSGRSRSRSR
jgi:hypothetical protein